MKLKLTAISALFAVVGASPSLSPKEATIVNDALPSSAFALISASGFSAWESIVDSKVNAGATPKWIESLPASVRSDLLGESGTAAPASVSASASGSGAAPTSGSASTSSSGSESTSSSGNASGSMSSSSSSILSLPAPNPKSDSASKSMAPKSNSPKNSASAAASKSSSSSSSNNPATKPTAVVAAGLIGAVGVIGLFAL